MKAVLLALSAVFLLVACNRHMQQERTLLQPMHGNLSAYVQNKPYRVEKDVHSDTLSFMDLFWLNKEHPDSVFLEIKNGKTLYLSWYFAGQKAGQVFDGKLVKQQYFEVYLKNKKTEIPPAFNFLYGNHDIYRIRISITKDNSIVTDVLRNGRGNVLLIIMGEKYFIKSFFKTGHTGIAQVVQ
ncbi:hypothetical protein [Ferruginibacter sp.]